MLISEEEIETTPLVKAFIKIEQQSDRVDPPFPDLPSFYCSATILSYLSYYGEV